MSIGRRRCVLVCTGVLGASAQAHPFAVMPPGTGGVCRLELALGCPPGCPLPNVGMGPGWAHQDEVLEQNGQEAGKMQLILQPPHLRAPAELGGGGLGVTSARLFPLQTR